MQTLFSALTDAAAQRLRAAQIREYAFMIKWGVLVMFILQTPALYEPIQSNASALVLIVYQFLEQNAPWYLLWLVVFFVAGLVETVYDTGYDAELERQLAAMTAMWGAILTPPPQPLAPQLARGDGE